MGDSSLGGRTFITLLNASNYGYCQGDSVKESIQAPAAQEYRLSGDDLEFWFYPSAGNDTDTSLQLMDRYVRKASGTGLPGEWKHTGTFRDRERYATGGETRGADAGSGRPALAIGPEPGLGNA